MKALTWLVLLVTAMAGTVQAGVIEEDYVERQLRICEPKLLERRIAESPPASRRFLSALETNTVYLRSESGFCSGTFITPTCVLTAAHCLNTLGKGDRVSAGRDGLRLKGGIAHFDKDYGTEGGKTVQRGKISGDDVGIVVFKEGYAAFKPLPLSTVLGNLNLWFHGATKVDALYTGGLARFEHDYWRNLGVLGLSGYTSEKRKSDVAICSDSAFEWSPCLTYRDVSDPPIFERGVICVTGEFGAGMSGGSFYNEASLFGILIEGPSEDSPGAKALKDHWWRSHPRQSFSSNSLAGVANRVKILTPRDRDFIRSYCPGAEFVPLKATKGPAVKDKALVQAKAQNQFWLPGGRDVWQKLKPADRWSRVNVVLRKGASGEFVRRLHKRLRDLKVGAPESDAYTDATAAAVSRFQRANGLPSTGVADETTLRKMGIWFNQRN